MPTTPDPLRTELTREWYVRVFDDQIRKRLGVAEPKIAVTATETEHVAECLRDGIAYRIHGPGGSLVLNPDGPQQVPGQNSYSDRAEAEPARPQPTKQWHRNQLEQLLKAQNQRRAADETMAAATWNDLTPDQRTAFAAYLHQQQGTTGPAAYPQADTPQTPSPVEARNAQTYTPTDTGQRNPLTGPPAKAAAETFGQLPLTTAAEMNAAHALVAKAFPKGNLSKPPTITSTGHIRTSDYTVPEKPQDTDRSR